MESWMQLGPPGSLMSENGGTFSHPWTAAPAVVVPRLLMGIRPLQDSWQRVAMRSQNVTRSRFIVTGQIALVPTNSSSGTNCFALGIAALFRTRIGSHLPSQAMVPCHQHLLHNHHTRLPTVLEAISHSTRTARYGVWHWSLQLVYYRPPRRLVLHPPSLTGSSSGLDATTPAHTCSQRRHQALIFSLLLTWRSTLTIAKVLTLIQEPLVHPSRR